MIDVFPFLKGRNSAFDYHKMVLPSFIKGDDDYAFGSTTIGNGHEYDTIYCREIITSDGKKWVSFQWKQMVNKGTPTQRPIYRVDGFMVPKEEAQAIDLSKFTLEQINDHLTPYFEEFQKHTLGDGIKPKFETEPLRLPSRMQGMDVPMRELPLYDIAAEVTKMRSENADRKAARLKQKSASNQYHSPEIPKSAIKKGVGAAVVAAAVVVAAAAAVYHYKNRDQAQPPESEQDTQFK